MLRKEAGDEIAKIFSNLMKKNINKVAKSDCSYGHDQNADHSADDCNYGKDHEKHHGKDHEKHHGKDHEKHHVEDNDAGDCSYGQDHSMETSMSNMAADMMSMGDDKVMSSAVDEMQNVIDSNNSIDPKMANLMKGLGKIAASLRHEGESFAADVVEATAISIHKDYKKASSENSYVTTELNKIAKELTNANDRFAADLVYATINKINSK